MNKVLFGLVMVAILAASPLFSQTVQVGDTAPEFSASTVNGTEFSLYETANDSIVVIYFMGYS